MFKSIHLGESTHEKIRKKVDEENEKRTKKRMDTLLKIESECEQIIRSLNKLKEDIDRLERKVDIHDSRSKDKLIEICDIVNEINENMIKKD